MTIRQLVENYFAAVDDRDAEAALSLFAPDAVLRTPDLPSSLLPVTVHRGTEEIRRALAGAFDCLRTTHVLASHRFEASGSTATGRTRGQAHHLIETDRGVENFVWTIVYDDEYRSIDGDWRFTSRSLQVEWTERRPVQLVRRIDR